MALTEQQKRFADEYLIDLNATRAYKEAYKGCKKDETAAVNGSKLLRNTKVAEYIRERMSERERRTEITQDWVLQELYKIASANGTDFAQIIQKPLLRNGEPVINPITCEPELVDVVHIIPTAELPEDKRAAIACIKEGKYGIEVEQYDRLRALEMIGRHLGMFKDRVDISGSLEIEKTKLDSILQQMRGDG